MDLFVHNLIYSSCCFKTSTNYTYTSLNFTLLFCSAWSKSKNKSSNWTKVKHLHSVPNSHPPPKTVKGVPSKLKAWIVVCTPIKASWNGNYVGGNWRAPISPRVKDKLKSFFLLQFNYFGISKRIGVRMVIFLLLLIF